MASFVRPQVGPRCGAQHPCHGRRDRPTSSPCTTRSPSTARTPSSHPRHGFPAGRHAAPWAFYTDGGVVDTVFPPANKTFAMTQSHWFRIEEGRIIEHWANRDDLGTAKQLGWVPPTPAYLLNMVRARRRAMRS